MKTAAGEMFIHIKKFKLSDLIKIIYLVTDTFPFIKWYNILLILLLGRIYDKIYWFLNTFKMNCERKFFIAGVGDDLAGFTLTKKNRFYLNLWGIHLLCVVPRYRRRGVATQLINEVISYVKKRECEVLFLSVDNDNIPALNLYIKTGFKHFKKKQLQGQNQLKIQYLYRRIK